MKRVFLFLATAAVAVSCSEVEIDSAIDAPVKGETLSITVNASEDISSRVAITESDNVWSASWEQGDALAGCYPSESAVYKYSMEGTCTADVATFVGTLGAGENLRLIYPYKEDYTISNNKITIDLSTQSITDITGSNLENVGDNAPLICNGHTSNQTTVDTATATPKTMQHIGAALQVRMQFKNLDADYAIKSVTIKDVPATAEIDLTKGVDEDDFCTSTNGDITLTPESTTVITNGDIYELSCNIIPFEVVATGTLAIEVTVIETTSVSATVSSKAAGDTITKEFQITNQSATESIEFSRGMVHWVNFVCDFDSSATAPDVSSDKTTLIAIQSELDPAVVLNWATAEDAWEGVTFDANGYVTAIELSNKGLTGTIPSDLSTLSSLETLDLSDNSLTGNVPASFEDLVNMTTFKISGNSLSGTFPADVVNNPNYVTWDPMDNVFPQNGETKDSDGATAANVAAYSLKLNVVGILRAVYWHCGGPSWTYNNIAVDDYPDSEILTLNESTGKYEPEWLRGLADEGLVSNQKTILATMGGGTTIQQFGPVNGTAQSMRNMSGTLPLEIAMQGATALAQVKMDNSGITGIDTRILGGVKYIKFANCTLEQDINGILTNCLALAEVNLPNCSLTGEVSDATFAKVNSGVKPTITNNSALTGSITDAKFADFGITEDTDKAAFVSGTGITYTASVVE